MIKLITLPRVRGCGNRVRRNMYTQSKKFRESKSMAQCKYCKTKKVHWAATEYGWLLFEKSGNRHKCKESK